MVDFYVEKLLWLHDLKLDVPVDLRREKKQFALPLLRWMLAYVLYGGMEKGIVYTWPCGRPLEIAPETVDEAFDGVVTEHLPVTDDWSDEVERGYDRGIRDAVNRAVAGQIIQKPSKKRWLAKLILLDLARQTLDHDLFNDR